MASGKFNDHYLLGLARAVTIVQQYGLVTDTPTTAYEIGTHTVLPNSSLESILRYELQPYDLAEEVEPGMWIVRALPANPHETPSQ